MEERDGGEGGVRCSRVPVCEAERCAVHHPQTGRQGRLGSLFLPRYKGSLDGLRRPVTTFRGGSRTAAVPA